jgi:peptide/nickel transport system substrate-binding protein
MNVRRLPRTGTTRHRLRLVKLSFVLLPLLAVALSFVASGSGGRDAAGATSAAHAKSELVFARLADISGLDPLVGSDNPTIWVDQLLYTNLYISTVDGRSTQPQLAIRHTVSKNGLTWTFQLRPGVRFSDGTPLTAQDVVFSLNRDRDPKLIWGFTLGAVKSIRAVGTNKVVIETKQPFAPLLADLSLFANAIIPKNFGGQTAKQFFAHPVSSGPYVLQSWKRGSSVVLVANPHWWGPTLTVRKLTFNAVSNDNSRLLQLQGGQADIAEAPPLSQISSLQSKPGLTVKLFKSTLSRWLLLNFKQGPLGDLHVRRAIWYALNRPAIVRAATFGNAVASNSILSPNTPFYAPKTPTLPYDLAKAKQEMAASSAPHGFSTTLIIAAGDATESSLAQAIQASLAPIGIKVTLSQVSAQDEIPTYILKSNFDMSIFLGTLDIPDPDEATTYFSASDFFTHYHNPQLTKLSTDAETTLDLKRRQQLYTTFQGIFARDAAWIPLYSAGYPYVYNSNAKGFGVTVLGSYIFPGTQVGG